MRDSERHPGSWVMLNRRWAMVGQRLHMLPQRCNVHVFAGGYGLGGSRLFRRGLQGWAMVHVRCLFLGEEQNRGLSKWFIVGGQWYGLGEAVGLRKRAGFRRGCLHAGIMGFGG